MTPREFEFLCKFLKERSGLMLLPTKQYLVESRLMPVVRRAKLSGIGELVKRLQEPEAEALRVEVTEAMTINESFFLRDKIPFDRFRDTVLPWLLSARAPRKRIRIWCAAAATGQEPYSLAMAISENAEKWRGWNVQIYATDVSGSALAQARAGRYSQFEIQRGLPVMQMLRYFEQQGEEWVAKDNLRKMVTFAEHNMLNSARHFGTFDVVLCRNMLMYLCDDKRGQVLDGIAPLLADDGILMLGAAETVIGQTQRFKASKEFRGFYQPAAAKIEAQPMEYRRTA